MDIDKILSDTSIKYFSGDNCKIRSTLNEQHIFDPANKIYLMMEGDCLFTLEQRQKITVHKLLPGEMIFIPAGFRHSIYKDYKPEEKISQKIWVQFQFDSGGKNIFDLFSFPYFIKPKDYKKSLELMKNVINFGRNQSVLSRLQLHSAIIDLVVYFLSEANAQFQEDTEYSIEKIVQYIDHNLDHDFSVDTLASMAHIHPNYFIEKFKKLTGASPMKYISSKRMQYAVSHLEHTTMPISEIMANVGFTDPGHFSKKFKQYYGVSPTEMRNTRGKIGKSPNSPI